MPEECKARHATMLSGAYPSGEQNRQGTMQGDEMKH
jgi:hypothetical protein